jgi:pyruvate/2-oxoglutarate dehydrogenase complex dihydrolipoamide dehydrogenase (E3) component
MFFGDARFASGRLAGRRRQAHRLPQGPRRNRLAANGAPIPGLEEVGYRTSRSIFELTAFPRRIAVIGGGPLGCEAAQAFCRLGAHVTIVQDEPKFLPHEERDASQLLSFALARTAWTRA